MANNAALKAAGITLANATASQSLVFQNSNGERLDVMTAGDTTNILGLGTYALASPSTATSMDYTSITSTTGSGAPTTMQLGISINGGKTVIDTGALSVVGASAAANQASAIGLLNAFFASNASAQAAGLQAVAGAGNTVTLQSSNGTAFRVNEQTGSATTSLSFSNASTGATIVDNKQDVMRGTAAQGTYANVTGATLVVNVNGTNTTLDISASGNTAGLVTALDGVAGIGASSVVGRTVITGDAANTKVKIVSGDATALAALGLSVGDNNISDATTVNSGGAYNTALGTNNDVFRFSTARNAPTHRRWASL